MDWDGTNFITFCDNHCHMHENYEDQWWKNRLKTKFKHIIYKLKQNHKRLTTRTSSVQIKMQTNL